MLQMQLKLLQKEQFKVENRLLENRGILLKENTEKIISQGRFLSNFLGRLMKVGLPLMKTVPRSLAKRILIVLGLTATVSATDAAI